MATLAPSLVVWRSELNVRWPQRDKTSDGWIGDAAHADRTSDHNPGARGLVHAFDSDEDLDGNPRDDGPELWAIAEMLRTSRDHRIRYVIYEGRIFTSYPAGGRRAWEWGPYGGVNAHRKHLHLSILSTVAAEQDTRTWFADATNSTQEDLDMPIIVAAPKRPAALLSGNELVPFADQVTLAGLNNGGVPTCPVSTADYDRFLTGFSTATDEQVADALARSDMRLAALVDIGARTEARDTTA
jgi:hypothetical protein